MTFLDWLFSATPETVNNDDKVAIVGGFCDANGKFFPTETPSKNTQVTKKSSSGIFRPTTFNQFIGQKNAKNLLKRFIAGTKQRKLVFPHTLIHGSAGFGKTTLIKLVSCQLKVPFVETITSDIPDFKTLRNYIDMARGGILFLDELHSIDRNNAEKLYSIMEDFSYNGDRVEPFSLFGATTEIGEIIQNRKPFYDRFKIIIQLEDYSDEDLVQIVSQYNNKVFPKDQLTKDTHNLIALNSRRTPRTAIRLLEATVYFNGNIKEVLKSYDIIGYGFTNTDLKVLQHINEGGNSVGVQGLVSYLGTSEANYIYSIEPYLLSSGLIIRTPRGRKITEKGLRLMKKLQRK